MEAADSMDALISNSTLDQMHCDSFKIAKSLNEEGFELCEILEFIKDYIFEDLLAHIEVKFDDEKAAIIRREEVIRLANEFNSLNLTSEEKQLFIR